VDPALRRRVEEVWAVRLGCDASVFRTPGIHLIAHPQPAVLYAVLVGEAAIVAAPQKLHAALRDLPGPAAAVEAEALGRLVPRDARWVGPAFVGYTAARPPPPAIEVRRVALAELDPLKRAVSAIEWEHAGLETAEPIFAAFAEAAVASAAGARLLNGNVAHIGVVTLSAQRGRGLGRAVVTAALAHALDEGRLAQYQTLRANRGAMSIARALGFDAFATTLSARWRHA
jgi:GNAT superfamily N-acetyltransferase